VATKKTISISVDKDIDEFMEGIRTKVINIDGREIKMNRKKSEVYQKCLEFGIENADKWVLILLIGLFISPLFNLLI
jgi:hypothetical protein